MKQIPTGIAGLIDMVKKNLLGLGLIWFSSNLKVHHVHKVGIFQIKISAGSTQKAQNHKNMATSILETF